MSAPPGGPPGIPPPPPFLPPPWTEHRAPAGQPYWFNPQTNVSTYTRPLPPPPPPGFGGPGMPPQQFAPPMRFGGPPQAAAAPAPEKKEKKEKPKEKLPIDGTDWIKVTTNKGNVFYTNKTSKESVWTVPDEIKDVLEEMEKASNGGKKRKASEEQEDGAEGATTAEPSKVEVEVEGAEGVKPLPAESTEEVIIEPKKKKKKKAQVVREIEEMEQDEDWQRQVAEEMAQEAAAAEAKEAAAEPAAPVDMSALPQRPTEPDAVTRAPRINVSDEEGVAMFKAMLAEKDISPMAPWDMELPKFINDPRYLAVKQLKARRDLFEEFCKEKIREIRAAKKKAQEAGGDKVDPLTAYRALLLTAVTSTRTHFSDFKRAHAKDPRFRDFGKTEGEKEKVFKGWLRELGERKRAEAEKAEQRFVEMLKADKDIKEGDKWAEVKTRHVSDPRYSAVNSSSLRESLFTKHVASLSGAVPSSGSNVSSSAPAAASKEERAARAAASLREREEQVRQEKERMARSAQAARGAMGREEGEREWGTLLVDVVRDHEARWDDVLPALSREPRFTSSPLSPPEQRRLFEAHLRNLYSKRLALVENLFLANAPSLTTPFTTVLPAITDNPHVKALVGTDYDRLESLFNSWNRRRTETARADFDQLMKESPILEHWGRLQKREEADENGKKLAIGEEGAEDDDEDEAPSLTEMAKQVDLKAIHAVLKHDKRYLVFDHDPEARARWVEEYLRNLAAPKSTVHQRD